MKPLLPSQKGNVIKYRSIVRVVAPNKWDKDALSGVIGIPGNLSPQGIEEISPSIEEHIDPHAHADEALGEADDIGAEVIDEDGLKKLDRQIRLTAKDFRRFGFTPGCPRCLDLEAGAFRTERHHNDDCRLRMYLAFREANNAKWRAVRHLVEPEPDAAFNRQNVDLEEARVDKAPQALDGKNVLDNSVEHEPSVENIAEQPQAPEMEGIEGSAEVDQEQLDARDAADIAFADCPMDDNEDDAAMIFGDFDDDAENSMAMALTMAGVPEEKAKVAAYSMNQRIPTQTFIEVYGRSIRDQSLVTRRNLNIKGLDAMDLRTTKPNGDPWNFCKREDRRLARDMIEKQNPDWILGAPPCTAFAIWNYAMNYPKMNPDRVKELPAEGRVHLNFMASLYRRQIAKGTYDLHEHPATALSWKEDVIEALARHPLAKVVTADQCRYGLVTPSAEDPQK